MHSVLLSAAAGEGWVLVCSGCTVLLGAAHDLAMIKANMILVFGWTHLMGEYTSGDLFCSLWHFSQVYAVYCLLNLMNGLIKWLGKSPSGPPSQAMPLLDFFCLYFQVTRRNPGTNFSRSFIEHVHLATIKFPSQPLNCWRPGPTVGPRMGS